MFTEKKVAIKVHKIDIPNWFELQPIRLFHPDTEVNNMTENDRKCDCQNSSLKVHKFTALIKVDGIETPLRYEELASNLEEFKAIISKKHNAFTFLTFQEDF